MGEEVLVLVIGMLCGPIGRRGRGLDGPSAAENDEGRAWRPALVI
jgi:hypothetical protein